MTEVKVLILGRLMKKLSKISLLFTLLLLTACTSTRFQHNSKVMQCVNQCNLKAQYCQRHCGNNCPNCTLMSYQNSKARFIKYLHECDIQGKIVLRELNSYRDPLQCRKVTCNCVADLEVCKQNCSGIIYKRLQTAPNCI